VDDQLRKDGMNAANPSEAELVIVRTFNAPRAVVWRAWTDPEQMLRWMGPRGFTASQNSGEIRPGGPWRLCLRRDETGEEMWQGGVYREVVEPERMVFTFAWEGDDGKPENEMLITLTFAEQAVMTMRQTGFRSVEQRDGHQGGWTSTFDRLEECVAAAGM
jgi:uncharacterized protein YndB with AHSA1/START domain